MADQVLYSGVACITDLMVKEGLINLDFADVRAVMREMGKAMMGTGEATGEKRALTAAEAAIANPLIDDSSMKGARGLLISITGGKDLTLFEVDEAATRIREEVDQDANIIVGATFDETLDGIIRVSVVATGIEQAQIARNAAVARGYRAAAPRRRPPRRRRLAELTARLRADNARLAERAQKLEPAAASQAVAPAPAQAPPRRRNVRPACRARGARRDRRGGRGRRTRRADRSRRPMATSRCARSRRSRRCSRIHKEAARRRARAACDARNLHPAGGRTCAGPPRRGCRNSRISRCRRRPKSGGLAASRGRASAEVQAVAAAAARQYRPRPPRRRDRAADRGARFRSRDGSACRRCPIASRSVPSPSKWRRMHEPVSEYAKRPAPQSLDVHSRPAPVAPAPQGDDHLDIPAFLRRQAN